MEHLLVSCSLRITYYSLPLYRVHGVDNPEMLTTNYLSKVARGLCLLIGCVFLSTVARAQQGYLAPSFEVLKPTVPELVGVWERPRPEL